MKKKNALYSAATWKKIQACGQAVEAALTTSGLQLTMGGEPTFVPINPEGAEWQTAALGPTKRGYARRLARQLVEEIYPGAIVLETSGKLYPGEPLPRWALLIQHRIGGPPLWRDITRLRGDTEPGTHTLRQAERALSLLAEKLCVSVGGILPCHETAAPSLAAGYVLPLDYAEGRWHSDDWRSALKTDSVQLFPGDSLLGLRLPLGELGAANLRRALTVEIRDGSLTVFIPPLSLEGYCALASLIETCLEKLGLRDAVLGGYAPPSDPQLPTVGLVSDPGVIEVNLATCATWTEYERQLRQLYAAAAKVGLCARKLQVNGSETGTGGGAHLVFGGPLGTVSPFFVLPTLLPSIIRYWQRHPALSYAFTGQYMGPSSQAPRVDETTFSAVYELEIACEGAERLGSPADPEKIDLMFRDLLMDRTGNTHRAEISIDKLWNGSSGNGRLGLVEFRAFETYPACAAQSVTALFIRAILARLAADPFRARFVRWGGKLHDRFFLPTFVWQDLAAICDDLADHGLPFQLEWLRPLWEWRFPKLGKLQISYSARKNSAAKNRRSHRSPTTFAVEFRQALEAWPLLGEQPNGGGTSRSVDASMDRIEAWISNPAAVKTGCLLVNGLPCAFRATHTAPHKASSRRMIAAAGVRFRAFFLAQTLHPHIPPHSPLLIEWVDRTTRKVVAAARWHIWNPRGQPYATRPHNEKEAKGRRAARWEKWSRTLGQQRVIPKIEFPPEGRHTLDLRRSPALPRHGEDLASIRSRLEESKPTALR